MDKKDPEAQNASESQINLLRYYLPGSLGVHISETEDRAQKEEKLNITVVSSRKMATRAIALYFKTGGNGARQEEIFAAIRSYLNRPHIVEYVL